MKMLFKTDTGWEDKTLTLDECVKWFKDHTDEGGNVEVECLIFKKAGLKINTDKSINWTLSDSSIDRDQERFDTGGWDLKEFKNNPVVQWSHDHSIPAIGTVINPKVKDEDLVGKVDFDQADAFAQKIERKVRARIIRSGSVGFCPIKVEIPDDDKDNKKPSVRLIYRKQELREFSICNVPANPNARAEPPEKSGDKINTVKIKVDGDEVKSMLGSYKTVIEKMETDIKNLQKEKFSFCDPVSLESVKADIEKMQFDIENLKTIQMDMSDKIDKDNTEYYQSIFDKTVPPAKASKESVFDD